MEWCEKPYSMSDCGKNISYNNIGRHIFSIRARYVSRAVKYNTKSFYHLTMQDRRVNPANTANLAAIFCPSLFCPQKAVVGISCKFLLKNAVKFWKAFLLYFTTLETYCEGLGVDSMVLFLKHFYEYLLKN